VGSATKLVAQPLVDEQRGFDREQHGDAENGENGHGDEETEEEALETYCVRRQHEPDDYALRGITRGEAAMTKRVIPVNGPY
jgi:hypothetical protein